MYNYGITSFLGAKSVKVKPAIKAFLEDEKVSFSVNHVNKVNSYIQSNWNKFSSFIDRSIKSGIIKGQAIKLNTYYDELAERNKEVAAEFESENLSKDEQKIINTKSYDWGKIQSFVVKRGFQYPAKDYGYTSKKLQNMPVIRLLRENNLVSELVEALNSKLVEQ